MFAVEEAGFHHGGGCGGPSTCSYSACLFFLLRAVQTLILDGCVLSDSAESDLCPLPFENSLANAVNGGFPCMSSPRIDLAVPLRPQS